MIVASECAVTVRWKFLVGKVVKTAVEVIGERLVGTVCQADMSEAATLHAWTTANKASRSLCARVRPGWRTWLMTVQ